MLTRPETGDAARGAFDEVLRSRAFAEVEPPFWERVLDWIGRQLERILPDVLLGSSNLGSLVTWVLAVLAGAAMLWTLVRFVRAGLPRRGERGAARDHVATTVDAAPSAASLDEQARTALAAGDVEAALRLRFRAIVRRLDERGVARDEQDRTVGEFEAALAEARTDLRPAFAAAGRLFERLEYGGRRVAEDDVRAVFAAADEIAERTATGAPR